MPAGTALTAQRTFHPYLRIVDFRDGSADTTALLYVPDEVFPKISRYVISARDLYISIVGTVGLVGSVPDELNGANLTENAAKICDINESKIDRDFLAYFLRSEDGQRQITSLTVGSTQPKLALFRIEQIMVPCPAIADQRRVAQLLRSLDDRIALLRKTNATLEAIAQALFKSWFVDFDPVRAKSQGLAPAGMDEATAALFPDGFEESAAGPLPTGWRAGTIGDVCANPRVGAKPEHIPTQTPYFGLEHMPRRSIALANAGTAEGLESGKFWFERDDVLFGKLRPYFHKVGLAPTRGVCSTDILVLRPNSPSLLGFVAMHASSDAVIAHATMLSNGARMPRSSWHDIASFKVVLPPEEVAVAFNDVAYALIERIYTNIEMAKTLGEVRDTLLPRLISGQLRLPEAMAMDAGVTGRHAGTY